MRQHCTDGSFRFCRWSPRSRGQDKPCDFCVRSGTFSRLGVQDTQKCPLENRNVAALMLTMPGRVAGDHPLLPRFAAILLQVVSPPVKVGWDTALSAGKIPHVHLVPLNVRRRLFLHPLCLTPRNVDPPQPPRGIGRLSSAGTAASSTHILCQAATGTV